MEMHFTVFFSLDRFAFKNDQNNGKAEQSYQNVNNPAKKNDCSLKLM